MGKLLTFPLISQSDLEKAWRVQEALRRLQSIDSQNKRRLRQLIVAGAKTENGVRFVEIRPGRRGHRLLVR
jgi:hypothetical protein